jgi:hypothetical protein
VVKPVIVPLLMLAAVAQACALAGIPCRRGQKSGPVATLEGRIGAAQVVSHLVPFDEQGTQHNIRISWPGQGEPGGARLAVYVTSAECDRFTPPSPDSVTARRDPCAVLSGRLLTKNATGEMVQHGLVVAGGPQQATPIVHAYKLHVVGDHHVATA